MRIADVFVAIRADPTEFNAAIRGLDANLKNVSRNLGQIGSAMTRNITLPLVAIAGGTSKMALDFERTFGQLVGLAGVSKGSIDELRDSIFELSSATGKGPQELAEAFYFVASAGFEADEAMQVLDVSARGSAAGLGNVADIARVLGGVINSYGKENLSAAEAADILTRAVSEGAAEATDFAAVLPQVIPTAAQLGVEFEEVAGALAAMTTAGAPAEQAAVGLNQVFSTLLKPTDKANKTLEAFGLSARGLRTVLREEGTITVLRLLEEAFGDNDEAMASVFGNIRSLRGAFQLLNLDADQLDAIMAATAEHSGALGEAFGAIPEDVLAFDRALADLQVQAIEIGRDLLPTVVDIIGRLSRAVRNAVGWWKSLDKGMQDNIVRWALIAAVAGPVLTIFSKLITVGRGVLFVFKGLVNAAGFLYTAWRNIPTLLGFIDLGLAKIKVAALATRAALMSMILPVTAAVSALWLIANVGEHVFKAINPVGHAFNELASQVGKSRVQIEGEVNTLAHDLGVSAEEVQRRLTALLVDGVDWDAAVDAVRNGTDDIARELEVSQEAMDAWAGMYAQSAGDGVDGAGEALADLPPEIRAQLEAAGFVLEDESAMFEVLEQEAAEARKAVIGQMAAMLKGLTNLFETEDDFVKAWEALIERMEDPYTEAEREADIFSRNVIGNIRAAIKSGDPKIVADTVTLVNNMLAQIALMEPGALESGESVPPAIRAGMDSQINSLINWIETNVTGEALSALSLDEAEQVGLDGIWKYRQGMLANERAASTAASRVGRAALISLQNEVNWTQAGRNIVDLIARGVDESVWRLQSAMRGAAQAARSVLPESEPKDPRSPFRGLGKTGAAIVDMVAGGVLGNLDTFRNAMYAMGGVMTPSIAGLGPMSTPAMASVGPAPGSVTPSAVGNTYIVNVNGVQRTVDSEEEAMEALRDLGAFDDGRLG